MRVPSQIHEQQYFCLIAWVKGKAANMGILRLQRHGRIQEWVAEELDLFKKSGLKYEFVHHSTAARDLHPQYENLMAGESVEEASAYREFVLNSAITNVASTSHWAVSAAISSGYGKLWPHTYSVMPAGIYVGPSARFRKLRELAEMEIVVGKHSGSHFSAIYALRNIFPLGSLKLKFVEGRTTRLRYMLENPALAGSMYGLEGYILEQHGYRKVLDTSFMVSFMIVGDPDGDDVVKYFDGLRQAQLAIDEDPNRYKHFLVREFPEEIRRLVDFNPCGIGERLVFGSYTKDLLIRARDWVATQQILPRGWLHRSDPKVWTRDQ